MQLPVINEISVDIKNLSIYLRSIKKFGKSTLFRDVILRKYGDPSYGLLVQCGKERGAKLLDNCNVTTIETYSDVLELKELLINKRVFKRDEKGRIIKGEYIPFPHHIEMVCFDTADEFLPILEEETIRIDSVEKGKKIRTINAAMGGFQAGQQYAGGMLKDIIQSLFDAKFGVWVIAHTKFKTIKEKGGLEEDGYQQLTSNLVSAYESALGDIFDVTLTGVIDRNVSVVKAKNENEKDKRYATDEIRKLYFRGTTMIDAGGRFADGAVPDFMVFEPGVDNASEFIRIVEEGMRNSKTTLTNTVRRTTPTPTVTSVIEEPIEDEVPFEDSYVVDEPAEEVDDVLDLAKIRELFKSANSSAKSQVREIIAEYGKKLDDCDENGLRRIYSILK